MSNTITYAEALNIALNAIGDSNAEATDRLNKLIDAGKAQKVIHKKKAMYAVTGIDFVDPDADASSEDADQ